MKFGSEQNSFNPGLERGVMRLKLLFLIFPCRGRKEGGKERERRRKGEIKGGSERGRERGREMGGERTLKIWQKSLVSKGVMYIGLVKVTIILCMSEFPLS